jgi:DNA invertase Pin-like site-specific DNA recombinase
MEINLARSIVDLRKIIDMLAAKEAGFSVLQQSIDTARSEGRLPLDLLGAFAEFETDLRKERQLEGITKAKVAGKYKGRSRAIETATIAALTGGAIAKKLGIGHASHQRCRMLYGKPFYLGRG